MRAVLSIAAATVFWALCPSMLKLASDKMSALWVQVSFCLTAIVCLPVLYLMIPKTATFNLTGFGWAVAAAVASGIGTIAYSASMKLADPLTVVGFVSCGPLITFLTTAMVSNASFTPVKLAGMVLIVLGAFVLNR
jgi:drug/metabolite transporter (DMT)-like permease